MPMCAFKAHVVRPSGGELFAWDESHNAGRRRTCGVAFEDIAFHIERGDLLDIIEHPNPERYAGQRILVVQREDYV
jgi:hypothetical protein